MCWPVGWVCPPCTVPLLPFPLLSYCVPSPCATVRATFWCSDDIVWKHLTPKALPQIVIRASYHVELFQCQMKCVAGIPIVLLSCCPCPPHSSHCHSPSLPPSSLQMEPQFRYFLLDSSLIIGLLEGTFSDQDGQLIYNRMLLFQQSL